MAVIAPTDLERLVKAALAEDIGPGDVTSESLLEPQAECRAQVVLKEPGVVCGIEVAEAVFRELDPEARFAALVEDGAVVDEAPCPLAELEGRATALLAAERTALNLLGRLAGIATLTRAYVDAVAGTGATILDTRKTTPGLRTVEKAAVRCGGGRNHRLGLYDAALVKENHLRLAGGITTAVERLRARRPELHVEVEVESLVEVQEALEAGADRILLDNMPPALMAEAVRLAAGRVPLEASGGVTLATVREVADTGVDFISVGALTHSARSLDVSMEVL